MDELPNRRHQQARPTARTAACGRRDHHVVAAHPDGGPAVVLDGIEVAEREDGPEAGWQLVHRAQASIVGLGGAAASGGTGGERRRLPLEGCRLLQLHLRVAIGIAEGLARLLLVLPGRLVGLSAPGAAWPSWRPVHALQGSSALWGAKREARSGTGRLR